MDDSKLAMLYKIELIGTEHWTPTQMQALVVLVQFRVFADGGDGLCRLWKNLSRASDLVCKSTLATRRCEERNLRRRRRWKKEEEEEEVRV